MSTALFILAVPIGLLGLWIIALNWCRHAMMRRHMRRTGEHRFISGVPIVGPVLVSLAWLVGTFDGQRSSWAWLWVPWVVDEGTWTVLYALVYWLALRPMGVRNAPGFRNMDARPADPPRVDHD